MIRLRWRRLEKRALHRQLQVNRGTERPRFVTRSFFVFLKTPLSLFISKESTVHRTVAPISLSDIEGEPDLKVKSTFSLQVFKVKKNPFYFIVFSVFFLNDFCFQQLLNEWQSDLEARKDDASKSSQGKRNRRNNNSN